MDAFMMGLTEKEEAIISRLANSALDLSRDIREDVKWNALCYFKGDCAFVGIMPYKKYISVIFDRGVELDDTDNVLEGKGHTMRHIKIRCLEDLKEKNIGSYIAQSYELKEID
ncbi:DUF1801 domain-containing protein [Synechococcus sp. CBW1107]|uniref:DUF1801 domain-containing protein n=1 Tax=Synechococcus sp. CBW1107 TaxID=2789857 RepID=UPI002AD2B680|nr:DUF1801 domain-containing protein [Synechococcus sp. CBW1107]